MNSGQYPVQMTRKPMQERGLKGVKNPKTPLGESAAGSSRSSRNQSVFILDLRLWLLVNSGNKNLIFF